MMIDAQCKVEDNPFGQERAMWDSLTHKRKHPKAEIVLGVHLQAGFPMRVLFAFEFVRRPSTNYDSCLPMLVQGNENF